MKIEIKTDFVRKRNKNVQWIYFGVNFQKFETVKKKLGAKNIISLKEEIDLFATEQKENFINWTEKQRNYFNDSTFWLINRLSSKDNRSSNLFVFICQFLALKHKLKKKEFNKDFIIIAENFFLIKFLQDNLQKNYNIETYQFLNFFIFFEKILKIIKGVINYISIIIFFIVHFFYAKITNKKKFKPKGEVYLFHDLINSNEFTKNIVQERIYGDYPNWLLKNNKYVITLPWFYLNIKNKFKVYNILRNRNSFIPEDWINLFHYIETIIISVKSAFTINEKINYPEINIIELIKNEKLSGLENKSAIYLRYIPALKKWGTDLKSLTIFDNYQNQTFEIPLRISLNEMKSNLVKTKSIGYYHTLHSKKFLTFHTNLDEWNSKSKPNLVICANKLCEENLIKQGTPGNRIKTISDFQRKSFLEFNFEKKFNKNLLIVLSLFDAVNFELLSKINNINHYLNTQLNIKIKLRPHPYTNRDNILKKLNWKKLPSNWDWSSDDLKSVLKESYCVISMFSSIATDAILSNNILLTPESELNVGENFLDNLDNEFPILKSTSSNDLKKKISEIYLTDIDKFKNEFLLIRKKFLVNIRKNNYQKMLID
jgi:hypothetical protein